MTGVALPSPLALQLRLLGTVAGAFGLGSIIINRSLPADHAWQTLTTQHPALPIALLVVLLAGTMIVSWPCARWLRAMAGGNPLLGPGLLSQARHAAFRLPPLVLRAGLPLVVGAAVLGLLIDVRSGIPVRDAAHLAAVSATVGAALSVPVYVLLRAILRPVLLVRGTSALRSFHRLELGPRLVWALPALTLTAAGPPALVAAARVRGVPADFELAMMLAGLGVILATAAWMGGTLAWTIRQDVQRLTRRISALAHRKPAQPARQESPHLDELRRLVEAVNALLARNAELDAEHFVAIERLLEAEQLKVRFLAHMSHDLRAPLNTVLGFADVLLNGVDGELSPEAKPAVAEIRSQSELALRIVTQVLDLARVEAGGLQLRRENCPPAEIVSQALHDVRNVGSQGVEVLTHMQPGISPVYVDGARLATALGGLLGYVLEEMDEGPLDLSVETSGTGELRSLDFRLECAGLPVPPDVLEDAAGGMRRLPRRKGLGLGPVLAQRIVELHGGTMAVEVGPGDTAVFRIKVPG